MGLKRPGRPPLDPDGSYRNPVCLKLPASEFDRIDSIAKQQRTSMQDVIRKNLKRFLHDEHGGTLR